MTQPADRKKSFGRQTLAWIIKTALVTVVLYFLYLQVDSHWSEIVAFDWKIYDYRKLIESILLGLAGLFVLSYTWRYIIGGFGHKLSSADAFRISYLSQLGRYVPGKIWQLFGILYLARQKGISPEKATASFVVSQLFLIPSSLLIFVIAAQLDPNILSAQVALVGPKTMYLLTGIMVAVSVALVVRPNSFLMIGNVVLRKLGREEVRFVIDKKVALGVFLGYCFGWILFGAAFWRFIGSILPSSDLGFLSAAGIYNGSYQIGYLALFAPGGFGPRELVMSQMLTPYVGGIAPAATVLCRFWSILVELIATGAALLIRK